MIARFALAAALCVVSGLAAAQPAADSQQQIGLRPLATAPQPAPVHDCDRLAQPLRDTMAPFPAVADGVSVAALRWPAARAACTRAMQEFPSEVRFRAYAGRVADKAGDAREAVRLYQAAADAGHPMAQGNLGVMYSAGEGGLPRSEREAVRHYRMAADQGWVPAMTNLATALATGRGVPRDDREAVRLWQAALGAGNVDAQTNLGRMYAEGRGGLPRDMGQAISMWRQAAAQGDETARGNLRKAGVR